MRIPIQGIWRHVRYVAAICFMCLGCTAADRVAYKDCARAVLPSQVVAVVQGAVVVCGGDQDCIDKETRERFIVALDYFNVCVDGKDAGK